MDRISYNSLKIINFFENLNPKTSGVIFSTLIHLIILLFMVGLPNFFSPKEIYVPNIIPIEITVKLDGEVYIGESKVEVENLIPRLNAITEQNTEARIYIRGDRVVAYGRIMEIMSIINSAGYIKVALITQNLEQ